MGARGDVTVLRQTPHREPPKLVKEQLTDEELEASIKELIRRLKAGNSTIGGASKADVDEVQNTMFRLGFKPKEVQRRFEQALGKGKYANANELLTAVLKEV